MRLFYQKSIYLSIYLCGAVARDLRRAKRQPSASRHGVAWSSDAKLSAARAMSAFDTIQLLRERTTLDAQTRQSLLNELGSSNIKLPRRRALV